MTKLARFTASCLVAVLPLASLRAADSPPPVIERAPETDSSKLQQDIAALRAENERITNELRDTQWTLAEARTRIDELTVSNSAEAPERAQLAAEKARAEEANTRLATLIAGVEKLGGEKTALESRLAAATKTETELRQQLASAQKTASAPRPAAVPPETLAKLANAESRLSATQNKLSAAESQLAESRAKLADNEARLAQARTEFGGEKTALESRLASATKSESDLRQQLASVQQAAAAPKPVPPELLAKLADAENKLAATQSKLSTAESQLAEARTRSTENESKLAQARNELSGEKASLESRLAAATKSETDLRQQLATAQKAAAAPSRPAVPPEMVAKVADLEKRLGETQSQLASAQTRLSETQTKLADSETKLTQAQSQLGGSDSKFSELQNQLAAAQNKATEAEKKFSETSHRASALQAENELLNRAAANQSNVAAELDSLRREKAALETRVAEATAAANAAPAPSPSDDLKAQLAQAETKLETVLRSFSLLQTENEKLKASSASNSELAAQLEAVRKEKAALEASIAANPTDQSHHLASRLAEVEDRLSTTLRSFTLLQRENDQLKADAAEIADASHTAAAKSANESANQISALFDELRQTQARAIALSAENSQLKTRLALAGPPPGSTLSAPSRPGTPQAIAAVAPPQAPEPAPAEPAARTHVVVPGDNLGKISRHYYGTPSRWDEILRANGDVIKNENVLTVGTTLRIP